MGSYTVNPEVLKWAREESGLSREEAAALLKVSEDMLGQIELGQFKPSLTLLRDMSTKYEFDLATLFMPQPLPPTPLPSDYRTIGGAEPHLSRETMRAVRRARALQEEASEIVTSVPDLYQAVELPLVSTDDDVVAIATQERERLGVTTDLQMGWTSAREAFWHWRWRIEQLGIIVTLQKMPRRDCRGFSLVDPPLIPVIVINSAEVDQAQIFSLLHEYCHILLRSGGICDESRASVQLWTIERFCNLFAATALMPADAVEYAIARDFGTIEQRELSIEELTRVARRLRVSRPALALRLQELGLAPDGYYARIDDEISVEDWRTYDDEGGGFALFQDRVFKELGVQYTTIVLTALSRGYLDSITADNLLGAAAKYHEHFANQLATRGERYGRS